MVHVVHSALYWKLRCIQDASSGDDKNVPPNVPPRMTLLCRPRWPHNVIHLGSQFNPMATMYPDVPHFRSCQCSAPFGANTCRNPLVHAYCNINCCPYEGMCGSGLHGSTK
ncbi:hypothetical protein F442_02414, partial [Phytophthora nicotianae P10297]